jgi:hypothetical protein
LPVVSPGPDVELPDRPQQRVFQFDAIKGLIFAVWVSETLRTNGREVRAIYPPAARYALPAVDESTLRAMRANSADREEPPQYAQLLDYVRTGGWAWGLRKAGRDERSLRLRGDEPPDGDAVGPCLAFFGRFL